MNRPRRTTVGVSRRNASSRSFSRKRVHPVGREVPGWGRTASRPATPPDPPAMGLFTNCPSPRSAVDLLQLARRPRDGVFRLHALHALGEHVHDDVFRIGLGGLRRRLPRVPEDPGVVGGGAEALHRLVDRSEEHTSELQSLAYLVCRLLLEKKKT